MVAVGFKPADSLLELLLLNAEEGFRSTTLSLMALVDDAIGILVNAGTIAVGLSCTSLSTTASFTALTV